MFISEPHGPYRAHLYADEQVHAAGGPPNTDDRVTSLCKGSETYGPLRPIAEPDHAADEHVCGTCVSVWRARREGISPDDYPNEANR